MSEIRKYPTKKCSECGKVYSYKRFKNRPTTNKCKKCSSKEYQQKQYQKNPQLFIDRSKCNRIKYEGYYREYNREYARTPEQKLKRKVYRQSNKGRESHKKGQLKYRYQSGGIEKDKEWAKNNKEKVSAYRKNYKHRRREWESNGPGITANEWNELLAENHNKCAICGVKFDKLEQDHIIPLSKGGKHSLKNIQPACRKCNAVKGNKLIK